MSDPPPGASHDRILIFESHARSQCCALLQNCQYIT
jgi:hypothetical protein